VTTGLVQSTLGSNGLPVFGPNGTSCITSAASFAQWYQTTPGVNVYAPGTLTLTNIGNNTYQYSQSPDFFPLDGQGFNSGGSQGDLACDGSGPHNFSFTTHIQFTAQFATNSQSISVTGDDDIWVFINGHLIIDLGGVHGASTGSFTGSAPSLAAIGISLGQTVSVDIFQAQRHTCGSDFTLTTSMANITPTLEPSVNIANTNSQITITFLGILQQSPDLVSWQNVNPQPSSPWSFSPSSGEFFRARR
jgi:fibro-slime domain-containing protein